MKNAALLAIMTLTIVAAFSMNGFAVDMSTQISSLERQAQRLQSQIDQAKKVSNAALDQKVKGLEATIDNLVKRKVQIDAQISSIENQIEKLRANNKAALNRQMEQYNKELSTLKQRISGMVSQKAPQPSAAKTAPVKPAKAVVQPTAAPKPPVVAPTAAPANPCPNCPKARPVSVKPAAKVPVPVSGNHSQKKVARSAPSAAATAK